MMRLKSFVVFLMMGCACLTGCEPENDPVAVFNSAEDEAFATGELDNVYNFANEQTESVVSSGKTSGTDSVLPSCATVTIDNIDTVNNVYQWTVDFGTSDCLCRDGKYRRGKIISEFTGAYRTQGASLRTTLQDYVVEKRYAVEGERLTTNLGNGQTGNFQYEVDYTGVTVTNLDNSEELTWTADRVIERIQGDTTRTILDDIYTVRGTSSGNTFNGSDFSGEITTPLRFDLTCWASGIWTRHPTVGSMTLQSGGNTLSLDYDPDNAAACDRQAEIQFNDNDPRIITLR